MKTLRVVFLTLLALAVAATAMVYSGGFNVAADDPHWGLTSHVIETTRDRSISSRASDIALPAVLDDPQTIANGAAEYAEMCTACHLAPGMRDTELREGLYPMPPALAEPGGRRTPGEQFWIIKHGLKMTGMPAWGLTHDDERIWSMVAFLRKLPELTPTQYQQLVESGAGGHSHDHSHDQGGNDEAAGEHDEADEKTAPETHSHDHGAHDHGTPKPAATLPPEAADAAAVVDQFQKLLAQGKTREASALLDPGVLIFESGGAERSREEYASHHLNSDAEFLKSAAVALNHRTGSVVGDLAWIATESRLRTQGAKPLDLTMTETMLLKRTPQGWRVTHIHWSSKPRN